MSEKLKEYKKKRDLDKSPEPKDNKKVKLKHPVFVIQKHDASNMHYDFRIEIDGVLKSWAVPKGPSTDPKDKRLAIPTDDHPISYAKFEGVIPEGNYGAGRVIVWDLGTYENVNTQDDNGKIDMKKSYKNGEIKIDLKGEKLKGVYALIRTNNKAGNKKQWLLIKKDDEDADARRNPTSTEKKSVISGKTLEELEKNNK